MHVMLQSLLHNEGEMGTFRAVAIIIIAVVPVLLDGVLEHFLRPVDLHPDLGKIRQFERCSILVNQCPDVQSIKLQVVILYFEALLGKFKGLVNEIRVGVVHLTL